MNKCKKFGDPDNQCREELRDCDCLKECIEKFNVDRGVSTGDFTKRIQ